MMTSRKMMTSQKALAAGVMIMTTVMAIAEAFVELPKFNQLQLLYPGYHNHGGEFRNRDIAALIGGNHTSVIQYLHNTSPLRLSVALNRYSGRHAIGTNPIMSSTEVQVSIPGHDFQQYIFQNTAFGPFLAEKYGNPLLAKPNKQDSTLTMQPFVGKQGIVHFLSYHGDHAGGHIGLWDCDHFFKSPDWQFEHHLISVEFWETPDSYCVPEVPTVPSVLKNILQKYRLVLRSPDDSEHQKNLDALIGGSTNHRVRHNHNSRKRHRLKD